MESKELGIYRGKAVALTRREVQKVLHLSYAAVRRLERTGRLTAYRQVTDRAGVDHVEPCHVFDPRDVARYAEEVQNGHHRLRVTDGELAARCYELFATGSTIADVVIALRSPPRIVRELYLARATPDDLIVPAEVIAQIKALGFVRVEAADVLRAFEALLTQQRAALADVLR
jgi:hypothetical protein